MMSDFSEENGSGFNGSAIAPFPRQSTELSESQRRMIEKVLAFNRRLEEAIAQKNYAVIDECLEESKHNDYMAEHRQYMAELAKNLTANFKMS
jgi:hypothetical protein